MWDLESLASAVTGRSTSVFERDMGRMESTLLNAYSGSRVLITGGGGFIGSQTLRELLKFSPSEVVIVDTSENSLAELVRDLRARGEIPELTRIEPRLVDVTSPLAQRLIQDEGPFDLVLLFAAVKHVRSERDPYSTVRMLDTNINGSLNVLEAVFEKNSAARAFVVSTDKAADPVSLMGASKRIMEIAALGTYPAVTSTRFANVAFSSGSLLESWLLRLQRRQPLAVPEATSRFFISPREAGQLCLLASIAPDSSIVIPKEGLLEPVELKGALDCVLGAQGLSGNFIAMADETLAVPSGLFSGDPSELWPVLVTQRDTPGEKDYEVFLGSGEASSSWSDRLDLVEASGDLSGALQVAAVVRGLAQSGADLPDVEALADLVGIAVPNMTHMRGDRRLDDRI